MRRLELKNLVYNGNRIEFQKLPNYIYGPNYSGKTFIFTLIQFVLGIKGDFEYRQTPVIFNDFELEASIGDEPYVFVRGYGLNTVKVQKGGTWLTFLANTDEYFDFLIDTFDFRLENDYPKNVIVSVLRESFRSDPSFRERSRYSRKEIYGAMMGINFFYLRDMKKRIRYLEENSNASERTISDLSRYRDEIVFLMERELKDVDLRKIKDIIYGSYTRYSMQRKEMQDVLVKSEELLINLSEQAEDQFSIKMSEISSAFLKLLADVGVSSNIDVSDVINGRVSGRSSGEKELINFFIDFVLQSRGDILNTVGLLVNDSFGTFFDYSIFEKLGRIIGQAVEKDKIQFIGFTVNPSLVDRKYLIRLPERGGYIG
ncbi:hypothetical protein HNQ91_000422 [Filimonas zeae]|uniref:AAA domain-containing protein n=1 Tax=Filimonas zeae TaxID=1737353 RepID=A0A917MQQ5_9BACT|nr:ATP-binding protein [Filimonas zeae]MDR6337400.1 hypothetical protein [Filimonas zeae]GGH58422.1 hypothetical protein GCM10011379_04140 [Filimonas zeae]